MSGDLPGESGPAGPSARGWPHGYRCLLLIEPDDPLGRRPRAVVIIPNGDTAAAQRAYDDLRQYVSDGQPAYLRAVNLAVYLAEQAAASPSPAPTPAPAPIPAPSAGAPMAERLPRQRRPPLRQIGLILRVLAMIATVVLAAWAVGDLHFCVRGWCA